MLKTFAALAAATLFAVGNSHATTYNYTSGKMSLETHSGRTYYGDSVKLYIAVTPINDIADGILDLSTRDNIQSVALEIDASTGRFALFDWDNIVGWLEIENHQVVNYAVKSNYYRAIGTDGVLDYEQDIWSSASPIGSGLDYTEKVREFDNLYTTRILSGTAYQGGTWITNVPEPTSLALVIAGLAVVAGAGSRRRRMA